MCRVCRSPAEYLFTARVLGNLDVAYFQCSGCGFVQTEEPYWLDRTNHQPIRNTDSGQIEGSIYAAVLTKSLLHHMQLSTARVIDYGAGYGMLVQLLRHAGIDACWANHCAENLFAKDAIWSGGSADLVTCFEVAEHFHHPMEEFEKMLSIGRTILFSTVLIPSPPPAPGTWAHYALDDGQHIAFYTLDTLQYIARHLGVHLYSNRHNLHVLSNHQLDLSKLTTTVAWNTFVARIEQSFSPTPTQPSLETISLAGMQQKPQIGIAIFHSLGDIINATIIARQIKADYPDSHLVWITAEQYAFILDQNPDVDEIITVAGNPKDLDTRIEELRTIRPWSRFYVPAPYLVRTLPGGDLTELMLASYDGKLTVPLRPVLVLTDEEVEHARQWWAQLPTDRPRVLVETEFFSAQSPWNREYALDMIRALAPLHPVFVFTAKNRPVDLDILQAEYPDILWCDLPFRLNAELYNLCDAFIGVSSAISCATNSTWCRADVPHLEIVSGPHWSTWHFRHHTRRRICFDRVKFNQALEWLRSVLTGHIATNEVHNETILDLYTLRVEGKYRVLSSALLPRRLNQQASSDALRAIKRTLEACPPFYLCYGGIGDFLLALSTALDKPDSITVVVYPNSIAAAQAFFDSLPQIEHVVLIERHPDPQEQYIGGMFLRAVAATCSNILGCGVMPPAREDDFWKPDLDIQRQCGVTLYPRWVQRYKGNRITRPQVVLAPMGSLSGMFRSKRNILPPQYWEPLLKLLHAHGICPVITGTPNEAHAYPSDERSIDQRSTSFEEQFRILASADLVIAADSWHKTFSAMAGVPTIVFEPVVNHDLAFWKDSSANVFLAPWNNIHTVRTWRDFLDVFATMLPNECGIAFNPTRAETLRPIEQPRRTDPQQPLTSFHPVFWERNYEDARSVLIRLPDALGDALMITAITRALKAQYPHLALTIAASKAAIDLFRGNPDIHHCVVAGSTEDVRCEANADIVVDYRFIIDQLPEYYGILPMMDILANISGIRLPSKHIVYTTCPDERARAESLLSKIDGPLIAIHVESSKDPLRCYPHERQLLEKLLARLPHAYFVWLGTTPPPCTSPQLLDATMLSLREQIALAQRCDVAIVVDSVFYHVVHNVWQKPTILIAGPTSEYLIGDYTAAPLHTIRAPGCRACYWNVQRCQRVCPALIPPETIVHAAAQLLEKVHTGVLTPPPIPVHPPLLCKWEKRQQQLFTTLVNHHKRGGGNVAVQIVADTDPLPPYAEHWNGVKVLAQTKDSSISSLSRVFLP
ncbi:MAG: methyltransferase domain-containing protein [Chlorobi bacterium]|nr:methyltransferase domain-containing protein [Chlorobiota bacterium]